MEIKITDNKECNQYEYHEDGRIAILKYSQTKKGVLAIPLVKVPKELEGRGIAGQLTKRALEDVRKDNLKVIPICPYVKAYIERHPEWKDIVWDEE